MKTAEYPRLVALVGRPNVGKSTLFNRIIRSRKSIVSDEPGVTRDRIFGRAQYGEHEFFLCDTGGFEPTGKSVIKKQLVEQAQLAIEEAAFVVFVADGREGLHPEDAVLVKHLRRAGKQFAVAVNKCDRPQDDMNAQEFRKLGVDDIFPVSAEHGIGVGDLLDHVLARLPTKKIPVIDGAVKLALIGRPNVGKSSVLNRLIGEKRSLVDDKPGTTRDAVDVLLTYAGRKVCLLDTAGIRKSARIEDYLERFSVFRSLNVIEEAHVAALVIDAFEGPTEGDTRVVGYAFERRIPLLIVVNKWDLLEQKDQKSLRFFEDNLKKAFHFLPYVPTLTCSALENLRVSKILPMCLDLFDEANQRHKTSTVNEILKQLLDEHTPPLAKGKARKVKFFYATQVHAGPPIIVIFCSDPKAVHFSYRRYLENGFRRNLGFERVPLQLVFRERTQKAAPGDEPRGAPKRPVETAFSPDDDDDGDDESFIL